MLRKGNASQQLKTKAVLTIHSWLQCRPHELLPRLIRGEYLAATLPAVLSTRTPLRKTNSTINQSLTMPASPRASIPVDPSQSLSTLRAPRSERAILQAMPISLSRKVSSSTLPPTKSMLQQATIKTSTWTTRISQRSLMQAS